MKPGWGLVAPLLASCTVGVPLNARELAALGPPADVRAGMWITWQRVGGPFVAETLACVGLTATTITMEDRRTLANGQVWVTTTRHARDGHEVGVWYGPAGGRAEPAENLPLPVPARLMWLLGEGSDETKLGEDVETQVGWFACERSIRVEAFGPSTATWSVWHALEPLPFSQVVKFEVREDQIEFQDILIGYSWSGAQPMLVVPDP